VTRIDFYTHAESKLRTACQLCAKAAAQGTRLFVYAPDVETARELDRLLWTTPATGFVPHCRPEDPLAAVTPVIVSEQPEPLPHDEVLLNMHPEVPIFFSRFRRLVEIVSTDEADRQQARTRFRFYRDRGYELNDHNVSKAARAAPDPR
jgi:DNA polymerase-3 subunit chi